MKIYTRTGDDGTTGLIGPGRFSKADGRVDACGHVDELNATVGLALAAAPQGLIEPLRRIQHELLTVGAHLAAQSDGALAQMLPALDGQTVERLEKQMDAFEGELEPLNQFVLPGGTEAAARLHLARTVCRRAERIVVALAGQTHVPPGIIVYLNRLSDWFFVAARYANHLGHTDDIPWSKR
jgi:cob(I)alamin adenosyltransferase